MSFDAALKRLTKASSGQGRGCEPGMTKVRINDLGQIIFQFLNLDNVVRTMEEKERNATLLKMLEERAKVSNPTSPAADVVVYKPSAVGPSEVDRTPYWDAQMD